MILNLNNLREDQIKHLVKLDIISTKQAEEALVKPTIAKA
jgi:hypothetical protein